LTALAILTVTSRAGKHHEEYIFGQASLFRNQMVLIFWKVTALLLASQKRVENFSQRSSEVSVLGVGGG